MSHLLPTIAVMLSGIVASGCASGPRPLRNNSGTVHLVTTRDFAEILLTHCESGIRLGQAIESVEVGGDIKRLASTMRADEENDRSAIVAWIAKQSTKPSIIGESHADAIRTEHSAVVEQLLRTAPAALDEYTLRLLEAHVREQLTFLGDTPVEDKQLQSIVDAMWRRLLEQQKDLSIRRKVEW